MEIETPCKEWTKATNGHGYGQIRREGRAWQVHRWAWKLANGDPGDEVIMHLCHNRLCYRLDHLELGNQSLNLRMARERGSIKGQRLNRQQVEAIKKDGRSNIEIAREYGVTRQNIWKVKTGQTWN